MLGVAAYAFEAGCGLVVDGATDWLTGDLLPRPDATIFAQIEASGAPALLLEAYAGRLEYHDPWHLDREVSHLFRGDDRRAGGRRAARGPRASATSGSSTTARSTGRACGPIT